MSLPFLGVCQQVVERVSGGSPDTGAATLDHQRTNLPVQVGLEPGEDKAAAGREHPRRARKVGQRHLPLLRTRQRIDRDEMPEHVACLDLDQAAEDTRAVGADDYFIKPFSPIQLLNKVYALLGSFRGNQVRFHAADGSGYAFFADQVIALDPINPQVAARMARGLDRWRKFDAGRQAYARAALERMRDAKGVSKGLLEIASRALA